MTTVDIDNILCHDCIYHSLNSYKHWCEYWDCEIVKLLEKDLNGTYYRNCDRYFYVGSLK